MPVEVILPRVDMDMETAKISRWHVEEGASVEKGSPLFEIETDKAAMEIEAPASGILRGVTGGIGEDIAIGAVVARIYAPGEVAEPASATPELAVAAPAVPQPVVQAAAPPAIAAPPRPVAPTVPAPGGPIATPLARRLARMHGIDLADLPGSGPRGRVQSADVLKRAEAKSVVVEPQKAPTSVKAGPLHHSWLRVGEGLPALLIHGFGSDIASWRPLVASLPVATPVLALDLPAHGKSPLSGPPSLERFVALVEEMLAGLGIERFHAVGHSLGGAVATLLAARGRLDVRSLLLISPAGLGPDINGAFLSGFVRARGEAALMPWLRLLVNDASALAPGLATAIIQQRAAEGFAAGQERVASTLFPDGTQCISVREALEGLAMPVKLVFGRDDQIIPARHAFGLPGTIGLHLFDRVGHMPHFERRETVARLWAELLRSAC